MNDLKIMLRVLLLGLFVWLTLAFSFVFTIIFWLFIGAGVIVSIREAKNAKEIKEIEDLGRKQSYKNFHKHVTAKQKLEEAEMDKYISDRAANYMNLKDAHIPRKVITDPSYVEAIEEQTQDVIDRVNGKTPRTVATSDVFVRPDMDDILNAYIGDDFPEPHMEVVHKDTPDGTRDDAI